MLCRHATYIFNVQLFTHVVYVCLCSVYSLGTRQCEAPDGVVHFFYQPMFIENYIAHLEPRTKHAICHNNNEYMNGKSGDYWAQRMGCIKTLLGDTPQGADTSNA